MLLKDFLTDYY